MSAIVSRELTRRYRGVTALDRVTTQVPDGSIVGLLGANGAGKSTWFRLVAGYERPTSGAVEVFDASPYERDAVLRRICLVRGDQAYPSHYRVADALAVARHLHPGWDDVLAGRLLDEFALPARRKIKKLSLGMRSAVGIIIGLAARAPLTLFDEPYVGLDARSRRRFYDLLLEDYAAHQRTVVLSTHLIDEVADLLERVIVIEAGRIVHDADVESLRQRALTVTGPGPAVERFIDGRNVLHREHLGGTARVAVEVDDDGAAEAARAGGLRTAPVSLQDLVIWSGRPLSPSETSEEVTS
jgi:ABC-2 type transport system ATP-binding protein